MRYQLRFTGVGGQGVLLAGQILSLANIKKGGYSVESSVYTSQVRGGPTKVDVILDDKEILFPYAREGQIDFMLSVAQSSFELYKSGIKRGGILIVDPNLVKVSEGDEKNFKIYSIPIIEIASKEVGNVLTQSSVALGIVVAATGFFDEDYVKNIMFDKTPRKMLELNAQAYRLGLEHGRLE